MSSSELEGKRANLKESEPDAMRQSAGEPGVVVEGDVVPAVVAEEPEQQSGAADAVAEPVHDLSTFTKLSILVSKRSGGECTRAHIAHAYVCVLRSVLSHTFRDGECSDTRVDGMPLMSTLGSMTLMRIQVR